MHVIIDHVQTWTMRYKGTPLHLQKMMKPQVALDKACIQSLIQNYEELSPLITNVEASYACLFRSLDVVVRKYGAPLIRTLTKVKEKNQVRLDLNIYFDHLKIMTTIAYLQVSVDNMWMYIASFTFLKTNMCML